MSDEKRENVLLLFSGGRDSALSAIRLVNHGFNVWLFTCQNGHIEHIEFTEETASLLRHIPGFGDRIQKINDRDVRAMMHDYLHEVANSKNLKSVMCHWICLCCRAAMITSAVICCKKYDIKYIVTGDKDTDNYLFNNIHFKNKFNSFLSDHDIEFLTPIFDIKSNHDRIVELAKNGFYPKVCESKCWIGFEPDEIENESDVLYDLEVFDKLIMPKMKRDVKEGLEVQL